MGEETPREYELVYRDKQREEDIIAGTLSVPFQEIKHFGRVEKDIWNNMLIFGDNLQALKHLLKLKQKGKLKNSDGTDGVKLIFIDPPFGTGDIYDARGVPAYSAKLQGAKFVEFVRKRLVLLRELLSDDGSIYVRIDYHFGHYIKVIMDEVFGKENFINEIVISRSARPTEPKGMYHTTHDVLFFYSKTQNYYFKNFEIKRENPQWRGMHLPGVRWTKIDKQYLKLFKKDTKGENGEYYSRARIFFGKEILPPDGRHWAINQENIFKLEKQRKIKLDEKGRPISLESETKKMGDDWTDIQGYTRHWDYPTENSEELLERVIEGSSQKGDTVLDCFAGSGTTGAVAEKLGRRWVMADCGKFSIYTITKRLLSLREEIGNKGKSLKAKPFILYNAGKYYDSRFIKNMSDEDYSNFAIELFQAEHKENIVNGYKLHGLLRNSYVLVLDRKLQFTDEFLDDFHEVVGSHIKGRIYIIAPAGNVAFLNDYIPRDDVTYVILRIPYSIIEEVINKRFTELSQPRSLKDVNQTIESVGFDFIEPPEAKADFYVIRDRNKLTGEELVIEIKKFYSNEKTKHIEDLNEKDFLSMVLIDNNFNGDFFNMTDYFFGEDIRNDNNRVRIPLSRVGKQIMIIYLDIYGNELREIKQVKDFKKK